MSMSAYPILIIELSVTLFVGLGTCCVAMYAGRLAIGCIWWIPQPNRVLQISYAFHQIRAKVWKNDMILGEKPTGIGVLI